MSKQGKQDNQDKQGKDNNKALIKKRSTVLDKIRVEKREVKNGMGVEFSAGMTFKINQTFTKLSISQHPNPERMQEEVCDILKMKLMQTISNTVQDYIAEVKERDREERIKRQSIHTILSEGN